MIPGITVVRLTGGRDRAALPLLVLGPAAGTSASELWATCAADLTDDFDVVAWDLPGHGHNRSVPDEPVTMAELAAGVLRVVDDLLTERGQPRGPFFYAGDSAGGAVGLQLMLDAPDRVVAAVLLDTVAADDAPVPGLVPGFDVRAQLGRIRAPVLVVGAGPAAGPLREIASGVADGTYVELPGTAGPAPVERPAEVARLVRQHFLGDDPDPVSEVSEAVRDLEHLAAAYTLELAERVRSASRAGLSAAQIVEVMLEAAVRAGGPDVRAALRVAVEELRREGLA